jgi:hypothetical protein
LAQDVEGGTGEDFGGAEGTVGETEGREALKRQLQTSHKLSSFWSANDATPSSSVLVGGDDNGASIRAGAS